MQPTGTSGNSPRETSAASGVPPESTVESSPAAEPRDEDSGLHDIRSLASSQRMRHAARRTTQHSAVTDDDILASSSAGWKAVALPEPAKVVSLPELAELPSVAEVRASERKAAHAKAESAKAAAASSSEAKSSTEAKKDAVAATAVEAAPVSSIGSRISARPAAPKSKTPVIAIAGLGVAAAAGLGLYFAFGKKSEPAASAPVAAAEITPAREAAPPAPPANPTVTAEPIAPAVVAPAEPPAVEAAAEATGAAAPDQGVGADDTKPKALAKRDRAEEDSKKKPAKGKLEADVPATPTPEVKKPADKPAPATKAGGSADGDFDALLKEAGVDGAKKEAKPALEKKSLSGDDIKKGMGSVAGKAQACYAGTQGTASVKLTVAPSGQVQKVTVTGAFAGTPEAACVEAAVKSASFPAWDGGPQSFGFSYLLSE
ncbi:MAG: hypothetical protein ACTHU0_29465 [Kofleriaceae bacterium]